MPKPDMNSPEGRAQKRVDDLEGVLWHTAVFIVINGLIWAIDIFTGGGIEWAYWVTAPWAVGLGFHIASYLIDDSGMKQRKYQQYLAEEHQRQDESA